jgi:hypothetical protein
MAIALVSVTDLVVTVVALLAADRAVALAVMALAPDPADPVVMVLADPAVMIVVAMTAALPVSKTNRSSVPSSPAPSSRMTRSSRFSVAP